MQNSDESLKLKKFIENIERLEEDKKEISREISDVYKEAKATGFDVKVIRRILSLRKMDPDKRAELEILTESYKEALGMLE